MICSLNQIEQTARKAVRGGGLPWGLADDAGRAVRWLHVYRMNGVAALLGLLERHAGHYYSNDSDSNRSELAPIALSGVWQASGGVLDPLLVGASLSDCLDAPGDARIETSVIAFPLLVAGFICTLAEIENRTLSLTWAAMQLRFQRGGLWVEGTQSAMEIEVSDFLHCHQYASTPTSTKQTSQDFPQRRTPRIAEAEVESEIWVRLEEYASRTYIEATITSRMAGAGAGLHDND